MFCKYVMCPLNILEIPSPSDVKSGPDMHGIGISNKTKKILYIFVLCIMQGGKIVIS